jgi:hypothetical protein
LPRRADRMARPARVRMRRRKPWVLARRRLFGWKVRLLTGISIAARTGRPSWCGWMRVRDLRRPAAIGNPRRRARGCENGRQHRPGTRYGSRQDRVKPRGMPSRSDHTGRRVPHRGPCSSCQGWQTRRNLSRFRQGRPKWLRRFAGRRGGLLPSRLRARSPLSVHSLWITVWMDPVRWSRDNDRAGLSQATRSGVDHT